MADTTKPKKILIVDDDQDLLDVLTTKFTQYGFRVFQAKTGQECVASAFQFHPDLIILDNKMPGMDGMTAMSRIREDEWGKNVPIFILTGIEADDSIIQELAKSKPAYYFKKEDIDFNELVKKVKEELKV